MPDFVSPPPAATRSPIARSVRDAAACIGISRSVLYLVIGRGELPVVKVGSRTLILDDDLRAYLARQRVVADHPAAE
jgi:excisionase family DNA binding protein